MYGFPAERTTHDRICNGTKTYYSKELSRMETIPCQTCMFGVPYTYVYIIECTRYKCNNIEEFPHDMSRDKAQSFTLTKLVKDIGEYTCNDCGQEEIYSEFELKFLEE
jgi:hypothetical protein